MTRKHLLILMLLRESFLVYGDANMRPQLLAESIESILETVESPAAELVAFIGALRVWMETDEVDESPPPSFRDGAWKAYRPGIPLRELSRNAC